MVQQVIDSGSAGGGYPVSTWRFSASWAALAVLGLYPLTNVMDAAPLVKLNSAGVVFCCCVIAFVLYHGIDVIRRGYTDPRWAGTVAHRANTPASDPHHLDLWAGPKFGELAGIASLSFFIHNAIHPSCATRLSTASATPAWRTRSWGRATSW